MKSRELIMFFRPSFVRAFSIGIVVGLLAWSDGLRLANPTILGDIKGGDCCTPGNGQCLFAGTCPSSDCEWYPILNQCSSCHLNPYHVAGGTGNPTTACNHYDNTNVQYCGEVTSGVPLADGTCTVQCITDAHATCGFQVPNCADGGNCPNPPQ